MPDTANPLLRYEKRNGRAYLTLNRPEAMNALNAELRTALDAAIEDAGRDREILVLILAGEGGRAFCAGMDLKELSGQDSGGKLTPLSSSSILTDTLSQCEKPVIAAIDGHCLAAGLELALRCDIRIATEKSTFGLPEPRRSLMGGYGLHHLSRMIPLGEALYMQLTGSPIGCQRAYEIGLVQQRVPDRAALMAAVEAVAGDICLGAPLAVQGIKKIVKQGRHLSEAESCRLAVPIEQRVYGSEDRLEGPRAFAEKRKPNWKMK